MTHLTGNPAVVTGRARGETEVFEISTGSLREVLNRCPDLSDVILQAFIARRQLLREPGNFTGLRVIGSRFSKDTFRVRDFLSRNRALYTWLDLEADPEVDLLLKQFGLTEADTPVVICGRMLLLRAPSDMELAEAIGIRRAPDRAVYDLTVVGAGPAGLAAAVYGASEGLRTVVLERSGPGGQAGPEHADRELPGFPRRHHRKRADRPGRPSGQQVRGRPVDPRVGLEPDLRGSLFGPPTSTAGRRWSPSAS